MTRAAAQWLSDLVCNDPEARQDQACQRAATANRGVVPCAEDMAAAVGIGTHEMESLLHLQQPPLSFDAPAVKEGSRPLAERIADPHQECLSDRLDQTSLEQRFDEILGHLDIRERQVLRMRYGLQGEQPLNLSDIGKVLRVSKERIRQIEESAMSKLRQPQHASQFVQFLHDSPARLMESASLLKGCEGDSKNHRVKRDSPRGRSATESVSRPNRHLAN